MNKTGNLLILFFTLALANLAVETNERPKSFSDYERRFLPLFDDFSVYKDFKKELDEREPMDLSKHSQKSSRELLNEIRESPYGFGHDVPAIVLSSRPDAQKLILEDFTGADDYFLWCLVNILSNMPSPQRDAAFKDMLIQKSKPTDDFLRDRHIIPMMLSLAISKKLDSIPIISKYAANESEDLDIRAHARIALNILGKPEIDNSSPFSFVFNEGISSKIKESVRDVYLEIFNDLLCHGLLLTYTGTILGKGVFKVNEVKIQEREIEFNGRLPDNAGTWRLIFGKEKEGRAPFYYYWYTGNVSAAGFLGVVQKKEGRWLCLFWRQMFIS